MSSRLAVPLPSPHQHATHPHAPSGGSSKPLIEFSKEFWFDNSIIHYNVQSYNAKTPKLNNNSDIVRGSTENAESFI